MEVKTGARFAAGQEIAEARDVEFMELKPMALYFALNGRNRRFYIVSTQPRQEEELIKKILEDSSFRVAKQWPRRGKTFFKLTAFRGDTRQALKEIEELGKSLPRSRKDRLVGLLVNFGPFLPAYSMKAPIGLVYQAFMIWVMLFVFNPEVRLRIRWRLSLMW